MLCGDAQTRTLRFRVTRPVSGKNATQAGKQTRSVTTLSRWPRGKF